MLLVVDFHDLFGDDWFQSLLFISIEIVSWVERCLHRRRREGEGG